MSLCDILKTIKNAELVPWLLQINTSCLDLKFPYILHVFGKVQEP